MTSTEIGRRWGRARGRPSRRSATWSLHRLIGPLLVLLIGLQPVPAPWLRAESELAALEPERAVWEVERRFGRRMWEAEGQVLRADSYLPRGEGPFPGVLMIHGGAWVTGSRLNMLAHANALARAGYAVVAIDYRLAPRHRFPAQLEDCQAALAWMRREHVALRLDPERIALYGYSAGGHLACLLGFSLAEPPLDEAGDEIRKEGNATRLVEKGFARPVQAIVAGGAPCDFSWLPPESRALATVFGETREEAPGIYRDASPLYRATAGAPPTLLYHGDEDRLVPIETSRRLYRRLQELGVPSELVVARSQGHLAAFLDPATPRRAIEFLEPILRPPQAAAADGEQGAEPSNMPRREELDAGSRRIHRAGTSVSAAP